MKRYRVGEVSKNWYDGQHVGCPRLLSEMFEEIVTRNAYEGWELHSFALHRILTGPKTMNETIIAVFEQEG